MNAPEEVDSGPRSGGRQLERITVNLTQRSSRALANVAELTGDSKTDTVNRALHLYDAVTEAIGAGGAVYVRFAPEAELERVWLL